MGDLLSGGSSAPAPLDFSKLLKQTLEGYQATAPGFYDLNASQQFGQPAYGRLNLDLLAQQQQGYTDAQGVVHPGTTQLGQDVNTSNRGAAVNDLLGFGPAASIGILNANPFLGDAIGATDAALTPSSILQTLNSQANAGLAANGQLSAQETRDVSQNALASLAGSGNTHGNTAMAVDLFSRDSAVRQRQQQAQEFAAGVQGLNQQQNTFGLNAANTFSNVLTGPMLQLLGLGTLTPGYGGTGGGTTSVPGSVSTANTLFPQQNQFAGDIAGANFNAASAQSIADQNNSTAFWSSLVQAAGAAASDERIKKKIRKTGEKTPEGLAIIDWQYITDAKKRRFRGVSAQEVERKAPWALLEDPISGLKAVDYSKLGISMSEILQEAA